MAEIFSEKPLSLAGTVEYSSGAVVSKTVINKKVGTITLFAFDQGQRLSEHAAPFDALVNVLDGEGEVVIGGNPHRLHAGDFIIMPANIPHAVNAVAKFKMMLVMIRGE